MSDLALLVTVAAITYLSRAGAVVLLPGARGYLLGLVSRIPAPLFASLAVFALVGDGVELPGASTTAAAIAAVLVAPRRSLGLTLAAGIVGFVVVELVL